MITDERAYHHWNSETHLFLHMHYLLNIVSPVHEQGQPHQSSVLLQNMLTLYRPSVCHYKPNSLAITVLFIHNSILHYNQRVQNTFGHFSIVFASSEQNILNLIGWEAARNFLTIIYDWLYLISMVYIKEKKWFKVYFPSPYKITAF